MTTLIIGGTGFLSGALVRHLLQDGHRVTILTRGATPPPGDLKDPVTVLKADRTDPGALETALAGKTFDAVYDMVAYRPEESSVVAALLRGRTGRFIHCSTVSVYMVSHAITCPVTEDQDAAPLMPFWPRNPFGMEYGILKRRCERVLWEAHDEREFPVTMLRPTYISGPADPAKRDWFWIQRIMDGKPLLVPGSGDHAFQQVFLDDVALAFSALLEAPRTIGRAYSIAAEEMMSLNEYLLRLGRILGRTPELVHIPQETFDGLPISSSPYGDVFPFNTRRTAVFDLHAIRQDLAYHSTPFDRWMGETARWWVDHHPVESNGYERRAEELRLIASLKKKRTT